MNRILIINPNSSLTVTARILHVANRHRRLDTEVEAVTATDGPRYVETRRDEIVAAHAVLKTLDSLPPGAFDAPGAYQAIVIGCFSDPGLLAARECSRVPVVGFGEATLLLAHSLGAPFSLLTNVPADEESLREMARSYHLHHRLVSMRPAGFSIEAFDRGEPAAVEGLRRAGHAAVEQDGARALCLACAAMAGLGQVLARDLGIPVLDGVTCALALAQTYLDIVAGKE